MRTEAQKAADKRYQAQNKNKYKTFIVHLPPEEYKRISATIKRAGMKKAAFIRWAANMLEHIPDDDTARKNYYAQIDIFGGTED